jgi:hypothetical protein
MRQFLLAIILIFSINTGEAQTAREKGLSTITHESIEGQLEFLASDWMEGRETGSRGIYMASDYLASMFKVFNIQPFGDEITIMPTREEMREGKRPVTKKSYFQNIALIRYEPGDLQELSVISKSGQERLR